MTKAKQRKRGVYLTPGEAQAVSTFCTQAWNCTAGTQKLIDNAYRKMRGE